MDFTKSELQLLDPNIWKKQMRLLAVGFIFCMIGIAIVPIGLTWHLPAVQAPYLELKTTVSNILVTTQVESTLKEILMGTLDNCTIGWKSYAEAKIQFLSLSFISPGAFFIGSYFMQKKYRILIRKLIDNNSAISEKSDHRSLGNENPDPGSS